MTDDLSAGPFEHEEPLPWPQPPPPRLDLDDWYAEPEPFAVTQPYALPEPAPEPEPTPPQRRWSIPFVALIAALLGALLGSGGVLLYLDDRLAELESPQAAPVASQERLSPTIELDSSVGDSIDRVAAVAESVLPTVVQINISNRTESAIPGLEGGNGSGVVYRSDGHIITNNHVVAGGGELEVLFADGDRRSARVVGTDPDTDLAVIKVERTGLTAIPIGDSTALRVGELAVAVGSPFGLEGTVTAGVISSLNRQIRVGGPDGRPLTLPNVIQTDAPINPGNSGGALVSGRAELIGINSAILTQGGTSNAGVGFAIPVNIATEVADQLIERGYVQHPFLGIEGTDVSAEIAERVGVPEGAYVERVLPDTPAAQAGLREGDVITGLGGEPIASMQDLIAVILNHEVGDVVDVTYIRQGEEATVEVKLAERPVS